MEELLVNYAHLIFPKEFVSKEQFLARIKVQYNIANNSINRFFYDLVKKTDFVGLARDVLGGVQVINQAISLYLIEGYWIDDKSSLGEVIVSSSEEVIESLDSEIFYYGITEEEMKKPEEEQLLSGREFVVTSYKKIVSMKNKVFKVGVKESYAKNILIEAETVEQANELTTGKEINMGPHDYCRDSFEITETKEISETKAQEFREEENERFFSGFVVQETGRFLFQFDHWNMKQIKEEIANFDGKDAEEEYLIYETVGLHSKIHL